MPEGCAALDFPQRFLNAAALDIMSSASDLQRQLINHLSSAPTIAALFESMLTHESAPLPPLAPMVMHAMGSKQEKDDIYPLPLGWYDAIESLDGFVTSLTHRFDSSQHCYDVDLGGAAAEHSAQY